MDNKYNYPELERVDKDIGRYYKDSNNNLVPSVTTVLSNTSNKSSGLMDWRLRVGAITEIELKEKKQRVEDALSATRAAMSEGILPGGGTSLIRIAEDLRSEFAERNDVNTGAHLVFDAVAAPVKLLVDNAGYSGEVVVNAILQGSDDYGFDAEHNQYGSMYELGIIDPVKVTRSALENAGSIAGMILTTESILTEYNPPKLPAPFDD